MVRRPIKLSAALSLGGLVAVSPLIAACGGGPSYEDWAATDGAAGRINLDDVQAAFKDSKSATDFEQRVNEIYEGDGLILVRAKQDGSQLTLEGWEDLNGNGEIDDSSDDQLFDIVKGSNDEYDMRGYHGNGYYNSHFGAGDFLFTYLLLSSIGPRGYYYNTPPARTSDMRRQRTSYRQSSAYTRQAQRNGSFHQRQAQFAGSRYQQSRGNVSSSRRTYQSTQRATGGFKSSNTLGRSRPSSGFFSSYSSRSGASGAGGAFRVKGRGL